MMVGAFVPFGVMAWATSLGKSGLALTIGCLLGALLTILSYAAGNPAFGLDPVMAMGWAMLFALPACLGGAAGALLGWLIRRRRDRGP